MNLNLFLLKHFFYEKNNIFLKKKYNCIPDFAIKEQVNCEPREMRWGLGTPRLEGIDPDTPSSADNSLHRLAIASKEPYSTNGGWGVKPHRFDKALHRPRTMDVPS